MKNLSFVLSAFILFSVPAWAGPGHDHNPSENAGGPMDEIVLTDTMISNLGIKTTLATMQSISGTIDLIANIDYLPEGQAIVTAGADGTITKLMTRIGQQVKKGDAILVLQPRLVGNPPVTLRAAMDGYITEQNIVIGQPVTADQSLLKIVDPTQVLVRGQAFEDTATADITLDKKVIVTTSNFPDELFHGTIRHIDAAFKTGTRIRDVQAVIDNPQGKLLANMQANLSIIIDDQASALVVPQRAILGEMGNYFLYVQEDDHFYRRDVILGTKFGTMREIISGVKPEEQVVIVGNYQLQFITPAQMDDTDEDESDDHGHAH